MNGRIWTPAEDAILAAMARTWSLSHMAPFKGALRMSGFDRRAPEIRARLVDIGLIRPLRRARKAAA